MNPLKDLIVVDFSRFLAGPIATRILADLGAYVIKVESPLGDPARNVKPIIDGHSPYFVQHNYGKHFLALDLKTPKGVDLARQLMSKADIVVENYRPDVMQNLRLSYQDIVNDNPRLIYCSVSGYGKSNIWSNRRTFAPLVHAETGLLELIRRRRSQGSKQKFNTLPEVNSHGDIYTAIIAALNILSALIERGNTGMGKQIDIAMAEALFFMNEWAAVDLAGGGNLQQLFGAWNSPILKLRSGVEVSISGNPVFNFRLWANAMDRLDLLEDERFTSPVSRSRYQLELLDILQEFVGSFDTIEEFEAVMDSAGLAVGRVRTIEEFIDSDWARQRQVVFNPVSNIRIPSTPFDSTINSGALENYIDNIGSGNYTVMRNILNMEDSEIDALTKEGILGR